MRPSVLPVDARTPDRLRGRAVRSRLAVVARAPSDATDEPVRAARPLEDAMAAAARRYADAYGVLPGPETPVTRVRWRPSARTVLVAALALALVAGAVALRAWATRPGEPVTLPVPVPAATSAPATATPPGPASPTSAAQVVVDVAGAVAHPGVVRLPVGARVVDAIAAVGGAASDAELARLNLARVLEDGEQVLVPRPGDEPGGTSPAAGAGPSGAGPVGAGAGTSAGLVDLNRADAAELETLPGIGPVLAERIVEHRAGHPFTSVEDLDDVSGIGSALLDRLRDRVRV